MAILINRSPGARRGRGDGALTRVSRGPRAEPCSVVPAQPFVPRRDAACAGSVPRAGDAPWRSGGPPGRSCGGRGRESPRCGQARSPGSRGLPPGGSGKHFPEEDGMQPAFLCLSQLLVSCYSLRSSHKQFLLPCDCRERKTQCPHSFLGTCREVVG